ncbi:MAG: HEAT repeat domain-containing protein [Planctomycetota bacterium]|jgi:hypothetical protein
MLDIVFSLSLSCAPAAGSTPAPFALDACFQESVQEAGDEAPAPLDEAAMADLVERLDELLGDKQASPEDKVELIWQAVEFPLEDVVEVLEDGVDDKQHEVRLAALDVLGLIDHGDAMKFLAKLAKKDKRLQKDEELAAQLFKSLGRYGHEDNLALFTKGILNTEGKVFQARVLALGKIRTKESVEELLSVMNSGGGGGRLGAKSIAYMDQLRLSLHALLGEDAGATRDKWQAWWNANRRDLEVSTEAPELEGQLGRRWERYWSQDTRTSEAEREDESGR